MILDQPPLYCNKCGQEIAANAVITTHRDGYEECNKNVDSAGAVKRMGDLGCKQCAIDACPPKPAAPRHRRGHPIEGRERFDVPSIFIS